MNSKEFLPFFFVITLNYVLLLKRERGEGGGRERERVKLFIIARSAREAQLKYLVPFYAMEEYILQRIIIC